MKIVEKDLENHYAVKIYKDVLNGKLQKFPRHFWKEEGKETCVVIIRYLFEEVLGWTKEEALQKATVPLLQKYKLSGLLKYMYQNSLYSIMQDVYGEDILPWQLGSVPKGFWRDRDNCIRAVKWLVEEKLAWSDEEIRKQYNKTIFQDHNFTGLLKHGINGDTWSILNDAYPGKFKRYEVEGVPLTQWSKEESTEALRDFIENKVKWNDAEIKQNWRARTLRKHGVYRLVVLSFDRKMFDAIDSVYPGEFKREDFPISSYEVQEAKRSVAV